MSGTKTTPTPLTLPERPVRTANTAHLGKRYYEGVVFWVALLGPGLSTLSSFLQTLFSFWRYGLLETITLEEISRFRFSWIPSTPIAAATMVVWYTSLAYAFFATRYIREKMSSAKKSLYAALAYKDSEFKAIFERMSST